MKKEINPVAALGVAAAVVIALFVGLYLRYFNEPKLDPKVLGESRAGIDRTQERMRKAGIAAGGPPNSGPGALPGSSGTNPNVGAPR